MLVLSAFSWATRNFCTYRVRPSCFSIEATHVIFIRIRGVSLLLREQLPEENTNISDRQTNVV